MDSLSGQTLGQPQGDRAEEDRSEIFLNKKGQKPKWLELTVGGQAPRPP